MYQFSSQQEYDEHIKEVLKTSFGIEGLYKYQAFIRLFQNRLNDCSNYASFKRDIHCFLPTGSGKTLSYILPIIDYTVAVNINSFTHTLILLPTRELIDQCRETLVKFRSDKIDFSCVCLSGKYSLNYEKELIKGNLKPQSVHHDSAIGYQYMNYPNIIICLASRLPFVYLGNEQFIEEVWKNSLRFIILDEVDKLLDLSLNNWIIVYQELCNIFENSGNNTAKTAHLDNLPLIKKFYLDSKNDENKTFQPLLTKIILSATNKINLRKVDLLQLNNVITLTGELPVESEKLFKQNCVLLNSNLEEYLIYFLKEKLSKELKKFIVFTNSLAQCKFLHKALTDNNIKNVLMHGSQLKKQREVALKNFKKSNLNVLVSTDLASRGLHIEDISWVIHFQCPLDSYTYVHRIGRTARVNKKGVSLIIDHIGAKEKVKRILTKASTIRPNLQRAKIVQEDSA